MLVLHSLSSAKFPTCVKAKQGAASVSSKELACPLATRIQGAGLVLPAFGGAVWQDRGHVVFTAPGKCPDSLQLAAWLGKGAQQWDTPLSSASGAQRTQHPFIKGSA